MLGRLPNLHIMILLFYFYALVHEIKIVIKYIDKYNIFQKFQISLKR